MTPRTRRFPVAALSAAAFLAVFALPVLGQGERANEGVLQSLLVEVRGLRTAIEQMAAAGPRVQLAMGRLTLQEQRVSAVQRRLDDLRESITNAEREQSDNREQLAMMEDAAERVAEPLQREQLATQVKLAKAALARGAEDIQRLREQEAALSGVVVAEESRLSEIGQHLDDLERALTPRK